MAIFNRYKIGPSPFSTQLTVVRETTDGESMRADLVDLSGKVCARGKAEASERCVINTSHLVAGTYVLRVYEGKHLTCSRKIVKK